MKNFLFTIAAISLVAGVANANSAAVQAGKQIVNKINGKPAGRPTVGAGSGQITGDADVGFENLMSFTDGRETVIEAPLQAGQVSVAQRATLREGMDNILNRYVGLGYISKADVADTLAAFDAGIFDSVNIETCLEGMNGEREALNILLAIADAGADAVKDISAKRGQTLRVANLTKAELLSVRSDMNEELAEQRKIEVATADQIMDSVIPACSINNALAVSAR